MSRNPLRTSYLKTRLVVIPALDTYPESMMRSAEITSYKPTYQAQALNPLNSSQKLSASSKIAMGESNQDRFTILGKPGKM